MSLAIMIIAVSTKLGLCSGCETGSNTIHATDVESKSSMDPHSESRSRTYTKFNQSFEAQNYITI